MVSNSAMPTTSSGAIHCGLGPIQQNQLKNLNREILRACQSYNSTPRPFARAACGDAGSTSFTPENVTNETFSPHFNRSTGASKSFNSAQQVATPNNTTKNYALAPNQHQMSQSASTSSKFVHKQYNSPLDLYSMDNIRKTIEAHSEQIAPGVMGINFLKNEQNSQQSIKQSAVYQLVREEEAKEARHRRVAELPTTPPRSIDATAVQSQQPTNVLQGTPRPPKQPQFYQYQYQQQPHQYQYKQQQLATPDTAGRTKVLLTPSQCLNNASSVAAKPQLKLIKKPQLPLPPQFHHQLPTQQQQQEKTAIKDIKQLPPSIESIADSPICVSCGHSIVGVYARVGSGCLHPECFNCATCGTSLKNIGHFTVNDKIYCDIHARQVAALIFGVRELPSGEVCSVGINDSSVNSAPVGAEVSRITKPQLVSTSTRRFETSATRTMSTNCTSTASSKATTSSSLTKNIGAGNNPVSLSLSSLTSNQDQLPVCAGCKSKIRGTYVSAAASSWCRTCADGVFRCANCASSLLDAQPFVENANDKRYYCSSCFDTFLAPTCAKCAAKIRADCVTALDKTWHPNCFNCAHCKQQFNNSSFYLEDGLAYCERDWNELFTAKCFSCRQPIAAGDRWIEALKRRYHAACFTCGSCNSPLEGAHFHHKNGVPLCTLHM